MTRFFTSAAFCALLLLAGAFLMTTRSTAKEDVIGALLAMPAPPPPNPLVQNSRMTPEQLADKRNPPADDAPIDELMDYWAAQSGDYRALGYNILPSPRSLDRICAEIAKHPELVTGYLNIMRDSSEGADFVKGIYDNWPDKADTSGEGRGWVKRWLSLNSPYFTDQIVKTADRAADRNEYVTDQDQVLALARYDWESVRPTVDRLYRDRGQPVSQVLATWALYRHALAEDSIGDIDRYRDELKAVVEDKKATAGMRDLAFDALVKEKEWSGRDEWYYTLLADETLGELRVNGSVYTGLTTIVIYSPPDKYADKMIELVKSDNKTIRNAAVRNLAVILNEKRPDVVRALLPWLEDPKWAADSGARMQLVNILGSVKIPESVPGLLAVLSEKEMRSFPVQEVLNGMSLSNSAVNSVSTVANAMNTAANAMSTARASNVNTSGPTRSIEIAVYPLRNSAVAALGMQEDVRAVPALKRLLRESDAYSGSILVNAILRCHGFTVIEQADALEVFARTASERGDLSLPGAYANGANFAANSIYSNSSYTGARGFDANAVKNALAMILLQTREPGDALIGEIITRITSLEKDEPATAEILRQQLINWKGAAINALFLKNLQDGKATSDEILKLLTERKGLRENHAGQTADLKKAKPAAIGISACLLDDEAGYAAILGGGNVEAKTAMMACARLIRAKLSVPDVAKYISGADKRLATAAELYLESEDSPQARAIVLSVHPGEVKILGATTAFWPAGTQPTISPQLTELFSSVNGDQRAERNAPYISFDQYRYGYQMLNPDLEPRLQKEIKQDTALLGIYSYADNIVRVYKDRATYSWEEDESRYRERALSRDEFENFTGYLSRSGVDTLGPFLDCSEGCTPDELLMLGRQGGRRIFQNTLRMPEFFAGINSIFKEMRARPGKVHYALEKDVPGLEILFADDEKDAVTVWKNGGDMRLLVTDKARQQNAAREIESEQYDLESDPDAEPGEDAEARADFVRRAQQRLSESYGWFKLEDGRLTSGAPQPGEAEFLPVADTFAVAVGRERWKEKTAGVEIRSDGKGLYKIVGATISLVATGIYESPLITPNGRWAIATKYTDEGPALVRIDLATKKETQVRAQDFWGGRAVAFVPAINKVLVTTMAYEDEEAVDYYWLDAAAATIKSATGELRPLAAQTFRSLQPAANAFEFWAAIPDSERKITNVGIYNSKTFTFKTVAAIPKINFASMDMWVDAAAGKVYFVYRGQLLALPLQKKAIAPPVRG